MFCVVCETCKPLKILFPLTSKLRLRLTSNNCKSENCLWPYVDFYMDLYSVVKVYSDSHGFIRSYMTLYGLILIYMHLYKFIPL